MDINKNINSNFNETDLVCKHLSKEKVKEEIFYQDTRNTELLLLLVKNICFKADTNEVLLEVYNYLNKIFSNDSFELLLSQDYKITSVPVNSLDIAMNLDNKKTKGRAFLEGKSIYDDVNKDLAIPIKGIQGIYGLIYFFSNELNERLYKSEFIYEVAEIIGTSFENSQLYQQSLNWLKKLELINGLTEKINNSLYKEDVIETLIIELQELFGLQFIIYAEADEGKKNLINIRTNNKDFEIISIPIDGTYLGLAYRKEDSIIISDKSKYYDLKDEFCMNKGCSSIIATPIYVENELRGVLAITTKQTNYFSYDDLRFLQLISQQFNLSLTNSIVMAKIQKLAITDYLTNLYNRSYLDEKIKEFQIRDKGGTLFLFDLDDFKRINDNYGHHIGDKVLIQVADILKNNIRDEDVAARWGGEELAIYLPKIDIEVALKIGNRIVECVREETNPKVTISCGVAGWSAQDKDIDYLILVHKADKALYEAKNKGKDQLIIFSK